MKMPMMPGPDDGDGDEGGGGSPMDELRSLPGPRQKPVNAMPHGMGPTMGARGTVPKGPPKGKGKAELPAGIRHPPHVPPGGQAAVHKLLSAKRGGPAPPGGGGMIGGGGPPLPPGGPPPSPGGGAFPGQ